MLRFLENSLVIAVCVGFLVIGLVIGIKLGKINWNVVACKMLKNGGHIPQDRKCK